MTSNSNSNGAGGGNRTSRVGSAGKLFPIPHYRIEEEQQFKDCYETGKKLGEGSFGIVHELFHRQTRERWACKVVNKDNSKEKGWGSKIKLLEREVDILKRVNHEHIINLKEVFETPQKMYLIMGLCEGGELSKELKRRGHLTERETRTIMKRLTSAVSYLHKNDMVHRDIKLENILLSNNPNDAEDRLYIKVTDFGLSVVKGGVGHENMMMDFCGTPMYMAPEIIDNKTYSEKCDVWAMGVIMCALLTGGPPFSGYGSDDEQLYGQIKNLDINRYVNSDPSWTDISEEGKDCMIRMMTLDPAHRLTSSELLHQPWITGTALDPEPGPRNVLEMMKAWHNDLDDDGAMTSTNDPPSSAMNTNTNNRTASASSKPPSAKGRRESQGGESSQDETSAPTSRSGSANSGKNTKRSGEMRRASMPAVSMSTRPTRRSIPRITTVPSLQNLTPVSQKTSSGTSVKSRTNSLPRNSIPSTTTRTPTQKSPSESSSSTSSSSNNNSRTSANRNATAATNRTTTRQTTKPTSTTTGRTNKISQDGNKTRKVTR